MLKISVIGVSVKKTTAFFIFFHAVSTLTLSDFEDTGTLSACWAVLAFPESIKLWPAWTSGS